MRNKKKKEKVMKQAACPYCGSLVESNTAIYFCKHCESNFIIVGSEEHPKFIY